MDNSLPFTVRRAKESEIYQIVQLISQEPRANLWTIGKIVFNNMGIVLLMFISSLFVMITLHLMRGKNATSPLSFWIYLFFGFLGALVAYICSLMQGFYLYSKRYCEMYGIIQCYKEKPFNKTLEKEISRFIKKYQFYVAVPNSENENKNKNKNDIILGVIGIASFKDHCETSEAMGNEGASAYMAIQRALPKGTRIITDKTAIIPWIVINMEYCQNVEISNYFETKLANSDKKIKVARPLYEVVYDCLLKYVNKNVFGSGNQIGFIITECDDFQLWQQDIIFQCNAFAFVGERCDITWQPFGPFPNKKHFFMRVCDKNMANNMFGEIKDDAKSPSKSKSDNDDDDDDNDVNTDDDFETESD